MKSPIPSPLLPPTQPYRSLITSFACRPVILAVASVLLVFSVFHVLVVSLQHGSALMETHPPFSHSIPSPPQLSSLRTMQQHGDQSNTQSAVDQLERKSMSNATILMFTSSFHAFNQSIASLAASGFYGPVVVLCYASQHECAAVRNSALPPPAVVPSSLVAPKKNGTRPSSRPLQPSSVRTLSVHQIDGTRVARNSQQLMLTAVVPLLRTLVASSAEHFALLLNADNVRWCAGKHFVSTLLHHLPVVGRRSSVYALVSGFWSEDTADTIQKWSTLHNNSVNNNRTVEEGNSTQRLVSGNFFFGKMSNLLRVADAVTSTMTSRSIPSNVPKHVLLSHKQGELRSAVDSALASVNADLMPLPNGLIASPKVCSGASPSPSNVCGSSSATAATATFCSLSGGSSTLDAQEESYTVRPGHESGGLVRSVVQRLPQTLRTQWVALRRSLTSEYVPQRSLRTAVVANPPLKRSAAHIARRLSSRIYQRDGRLPPVHDTGSNSFPVR